MERNYTHARVLVDSLWNGVRLVSILAVFPRFVLAEVNTHRYFSRGSASSRAVPVKRRILQVEEDPFVPAAFGRNRRGMQAVEHVTGDDMLASRDAWLRARDAAVREARELDRIGVHKQLANRLLEPFCWHTAIISTTELGNFFALRDNAAAQPEFQDLAVSMRSALASSVPAMLKAGEWHRPFGLYLDEEQAEAKRIVALEEERGRLDSNVTDVLNRASIGRIARVSYENFDGARVLAEDVRLFGDLLGNGHMGPLEHVARPLVADDLVDDNLDVRIATRDVGLGGMDRLRAAWCGNFRGWVQYRKTIPHEEDFGAFVAALRATADRRAAANRSA